MVVLIAECSRSSFTVTRSTPERVSRDAGQTGAFRDCLEAHLQVEKPATRYRAVEIARGRVSPPAFPRGSRPRVVQRSLQPAARLAHDER